LIGVQVADAPPPVIRLQGQGTLQVKEALEKAGKTAWQSFNKNPPQLFLCITDDRSFLYNSIKVEGDVSSSSSSMYFILKKKSDPSCVVINFRNLQVEASPLNAWLSSMCKRYHHPQLLPSFATRKTKQYHSFIQSFNLPFLKKQSQEKCERSIPFKVSATSPYHSRIQKRT
jgi:hypothetical protein